METQLHARPLKWRTNTKIQHQNCRDTHFPPRLSSSCKHFLLSFPRTRVIYLMCHRLLTLYLSTTSSSSTSSTFSSSSISSCSLMTLPQTSLPLGRSHVQFIIFMTLPRPHTAAQTLSHDAGSGKGTYCSCFSFITDRVTHTHMDLAYICALQSSSEIMLIGRSLPKAPRGELSPTHTHWLYNCNMCVCVLLYWIESTFRLAFINIFFDFFLLLRPDRIWKRCDKMSLLLEPSAFS